MNLALVMTILRKRAALRRHETWTRAELAEHQAAGVRALREHAMAHSRFYQRFHRGFEDKPLHELPIVTKAQLMDTCCSVRHTRRSRPIESSERSPASSPGSAPRRRRSTSRSSAPSRGRPSARHRS